MCGAKCLTRSCKLLLIAGTDIALAGQLDSEYHRRRKHEIFDRIIARRGVHFSMENIFLKRLECPDYVTSNPINSKKNEILRN